MYWVAERRSNLARPVSGYERLCVGVSAKLADEVKEILVEFDRVKASRMVVSSLSASRASAERAR